MNSFGTLFHDKIFSLTFPWLLTTSLTFPWHVSNSLTFPGFRGFPDKWSPWKARTSMYVERMCVTDSDTDMKHLWWCRLYGWIAQLYDDVRTLYAAVSSVDNDCYRTVRLVPIVPDITQTNIAQCIIFLRITVTQKIYNQKIHIFYMNVFSHTSIGINSDAFPLCSVYVLQMQGCH